MQKSTFLIYYPNTSFRLSTFWERNRQIIGCQTQPQTPPKVKYLQNLPQKYDLLSQPHTLQMNQLIRMQIFFERSGKGKRRDNYSLFISLQGKTKQQTISTLSKVELFYNRGEYIYYVLKVTEIYKINQDTTLLGTMITL